MRKILILLIIPTLLILGFLELNMIDSTFNTMLTKVTTVQADITNVEKANDLNTYWKKKENHLNFLSKHNSLNEICLKTVELKHLIEQGDTEKAAVTASLLHHLVYIARRDVGFSLNNII